MKLRLRFSLTASAIRIGGGDAGRQRGQRRSSASRIMALASAWIRCRRPCTYGLPISRNSGRPTTGKTKINNSHAWDDDGRRFSGTTPMATILITYSTTTNAMLSQAGRVSSNMA